MKKSLYNSLFYAPGWMSGVLLGGLFGLSLPLTAETAPVFNPRQDISRVGAQEFTVSGKITDSTGVGLPGVAVMLKGSGSTGVSTGEDGSYVLPVSEPENAVLVASLLGFETQE
ncbi:MAG TPA: carboxypeptidase regulatory-like domain-containing protein, partial [Anseongella sp.]|nr:carboxypeptidase regulatory-like domain-containing protein [Anseongella sp.]